MQGKTLVVLAVLLGLVVAVVWAFTAAPVAPVSRDGSDLKPRGPAKDLAMQLKGKTVRLSDYRGKVVLIDFWATWCGPCRMSIPTIEALYKKHRAQGFEVMGVSIDDSPDGIPDFVKEMGMTYAVGRYVNVDDVRAYGASGIPYMVLVDRKGQVRWDQSGYAPSIDAMLGEAIGKLLAE